MPIDILFLGGTSVDLIQDSGRQDRGLRFSASTGGSVTNSAVIGARLGLKTAIISRIGKDLLGDFAIKFLRSSKVDTSGIMRDSKIRTPMAIADIDASGNSTYTFYKNTSKDSIVCFDDARKDLLTQAKILHLGSSFSYQKDTFPEALKYVKFFKKRGAFISFDPNFRTYNIKDKTAAKNRVLTLLKYVDLARLSEIDLEYLTGQKKPKEGLKMLKKRFKCEAVLTIGPKGSVYLDKFGNYTKCQALKVKIADTIGAGDAFTAGLLYKIAREGKERVFAKIEPNLVFASAVSAIICTKSGANKGLRDLKQVGYFLTRGSNTPCKGGKG